MERSILYILIAFIVTFPAFAQVRLPTPSTSSSNFPQQEPFRPSEENNMECPDGFKRRDSVQNASYGGNICWPQPKEGPADSAIEDLKGLSCEFSTIEDVKKLDLAKNFCDVNKNRLRDMSAQDKDDYNEVCSPLRECGLANPGFVDLALIQKDAFGAVGLIPSCALADLSNHPEAGITPECWAKVQERLQETWSLSDLLDSQNIDALNSLVQQAKKNPTQDLLELLRTKLNDNFTAKSCSQYSIHSDAQNLVNICLQIQYNPETFNDDLVRSTIYKSVCKQFNECKSGQAM
jgi:hypothetical protein